MSRDPNSVHARLLGEKPEEARKRNAEMLAKAESSLAKAKAAHWEAGVNYYTARVEALRRFVEVKA